MRILMTGASSFTGAWFARELAAGGHEVTATFRGTDEDAYDGVRRLRVGEVAAVTRPVFGVSFGDDAFLELLRTGYDVLCQHGADVTNYRSPDFDAVAALAANTHRLPEVLAAARGSRLVATGSVFEADEGRGAHDEDDLRAFSPYGLSKTLTWQALRYYAAREEVELAKFVIPNPFGPFEEPRFTTYLARTWLSRERAAVNTPDYVRDNIHVSFLARAYRVFVEGSGTRLGPSQYRESQGEFALHCARALRDRLDVDCELELRVQEDFSEPTVRTNVDPVEELALGVDEESAWDALADDYLRRQAAGEL
jgi:nucleoside-diphosphate-sugar epimerase